MKVTTALRAEAAAGMIVAPSCFDALSARLAFLAGFKAIHLTGFGVEATQLGAPDLGLMSMSEVAQHAARVSAAVPVPILVDIDTGFGGVLSVARAVAEMERAGAAGIHIEDQALPKHCPLLSGRKVVSRSEAVDRIKAALDARRDDDFMIVARTDGDTISLNEVTDRCNLYLEVGADMVMPITSLVDGRPFEDLDPNAQMDLLASLPAKIDGPVMHMGSGPPRGFSNKDFEVAGYAFTMRVMSALGAAANAMAQVFAEIRDCGSDERYFRSSSGPYEDPMALLRAVRLQDYLQQEERYSSSR